jgi:hypothetical protein
MTIADADHHPRLDWHLDNWARYMRAGNSEELACQAAGIWQASSPDFDQLADAMELRCAEAVDAIVGSLPVDERVALYHVHLGAVWRLNRQRMEDAYERARQCISDGLHRRGIS